MFSPMERLHTCVFSACVRTTPYVDVMTSALNLGCLCGVVGAILTAKERNIPLLVAWIKKKTVPVF